MDLNAVFERAKAALIAGDVEAAAADARVVATAAPSAWPARYVLALAEHRLGRLDSARAGFDAVLALAPDNADAHNAYGALLDELGDRAAASDHYRRTVSLRPDHVGAWLGLSLALSALGDADGAREAVEAAVRAGPDEARAWIMLGWRRHADGDSGGAVEAMRRACALAPNDPEAVRALAEVEADRGADPRPLFETVLTLNPQDGQAALSLAAARHAAGETQSALADIEALATAAPEWIAPLAALAKLAIAGGEPERARRAFTDALAQRPRDGDLWSAYLQTLAELEDHAAVLAGTESARAHLGDAPWLDVMAAIARDELGDHAGAADILRRRDAQASNESVAEALIRNLIRTGKIEEAERRASSSVRRPGGGAAWPYLATVWRLLGDPRAGWLEAPQFIQAIDIEDGARLAAEAAPVLRRLHTARAAPLGQSVQGGSQTDGPLFLRAEPEIQALAAALKGAVESYAATLPPPDPDHPLLSGRRSPVRFSGSWSVLLRPGGLHVTHVHPSGWLSSAFYVELPPPGPADSRDGWLVLGEPPPELGLDLAPLRTIEPRPGRLALFPSYTWHGTRPFSVGERLTVAFDIVAG